MIEMLVFLDLDLHNSYKSTKEQIMHWKSTGDRVAVSDKTLKVQRKKEVPSSLLHVMMSADFCEVISVPYGFH